MTHHLEASIGFACGPTPQLVTASESILGLLGVPAQDFLNGSVSWTGLIHPDDQDVAEQLFSPDVGPAQGSFNIRLRHADGRMRCIRLRYQRQPTQAPVTLQVQLADARALYQPNARSLMPNFVAMMENTDDFIYFKDRNHVFTGASQTLVSITDPSEHWRDLIGKTDYDVFPEAFADVYYRLEKQVFAGLPVAHEVQAIPTRDGRTGWVDNRKYPITNAQGEIMGLFGVARDITELQTTKDALSESEHRFRTIFEELPSISVQGYNRQRQVIYWNRASEQLYGYTREQALGRQLEDLIIPEPMREPVIGFVDAWTQGGPAIPSAELTLKGRDKQAVEVFSSHVMLHSAAGEPEMYCIDIDISERNRATRELRASESFLRTIIDEIPDALVLKDRSGNFLLCNQAVARLYHTTPEAMVGKHDEDFGVSPEMAAFFRASTQAIIAGGTTQVVLEDSRDALTGEVRHLRTIKKPLKDVDGHDQVLVLGQDITDLVRAQHQVAESEQRLQHVMETTREGIWDWHLPSNHVVHNRQWFATLLYAEHEIPPTHEAFTALIHPEDLDAVQARINALVNGSCNDYHSEHRLIRKDGKVIWVQDRGRVVTRDDNGQALRIVGSYSDISFQKEHQQYLERIAHYDPLTSLPNRVLLADRMQQAMAQGKRRGLQVAVAYLDLDGFKTINDQHGHTMGDLLLTSIASQFKVMMREGDTIARLGGDEFVAVFVDLVDVQDSVALIQRLLEVASRPTEVDGLMLKVSASIGVSFYPQAEDTNADQLLRQADQAMYNAKLAGKNRYHLFDAEHDRHLRARNDTLERLQQALDQQEFVLYYQPKVNLRSGKVVGLEALIRWQHPERGLLAPGAFLPAIEGHALSVALGEWVLKTALAQVQTWAALGLRLAVSVNISAQHLQQPDFVDRLKQCLAAHPEMPHGTLELEVLETTALDEIDAVAAVIRECAAMGVSFALDDFGTGYSSLTYLKRLPAQVLKIDQSFVRDMLDDPEDRAIVEGVLGLARAFGREAVAEGAETAAHCRLLLRVGCDLAQGYGIARPMPADAVLNWVEGWHPDLGWLG
ncbi:EAL domain-containing protein [Rhodoferax sp. BLA1]|uniref:EAL domain-containing protein n=1 Tax=Rhodoferax sp. BLA1 TaxID=2576062 RepID=UPI001C55085D|nr:EAL domain-containing protein [Rhodoferax sp. BLA1]